MAFSNVNVPSRREQRDVVAGGTATEKKGADEGF